MTMVMTMNHAMNSTTASANNATIEEPLNVLAITLILSFVMLCTLFGNVLVLLAFYIQPRLRRVIYLPIISLALADLLCAVTAMPLYIVKKNIAALRPNIDERLVCDLYRFSYFFTEYASLMSLTAISVERFLTIYKPLKYRNFISPRIMISWLILCWLEALFISSMPFYWRSKRKENCTNSPTANWSLMAITVNVFVPFLIMLSCHSYVYLKTLKMFDSKRTRREIETRYYLAPVDSLRDGNWKMERKATISFTVVIGVFVICWGPSTLYYYLRNLCPECFVASFKPLKDAFGATMKLLTFCNSFMNPVIYFWLNIDFRKAFIRVLKREWSSTVLLRSRSGTIITLHSVKTNGKLLIAEQN